MQGKRLRQKRTIRKMREKNEVETERNDTVYE